MSASRLKAFLLLLYLTVLAIPIGVSPIYHPLLQHVKSALSVSQADPHVRRVWWDKWYSWLFVGGPPGRWLIGMMFGFDILKRDSTPPGTQLEWLDGSFIALPHIRLVVLVAASSLLAIFSLVCWHLLGLIHTVYE
jgi:hypothetical protein